MEHEPSAQNCWAPELFYDSANEQFLIFWATTIPGRFPDTDNQSNEGPPAPGRNHRMYYVTTKDFATFSETKLFYDRGFNVIDAAVVQEGRRYVMFLKDETNKPFTPQKNIRVAFSDRATGPYGDSERADHWQVLGGGTYGDQDRWEVVRLLRQVPRSNVRSCRFTRPHELERRIRSTCRATGNEARHRL